MASQDLRERTKRFALAVIHLVRALPNDVAADIIGRQLLRAGTSVAANYRAACRARSRKELVTKLGIVEEEADEVILWLELLTESGYPVPPQTAGLREEADQLLAISIASIRTARRTARMRNGSRR